MGRKGAEKIISLVKTINKLKQKQNKKKDIAFNVWRKKREKRMKLPVSLHF